MIDKIIEILETHEWVQRKKIQRDKEGNITGFCLAGAIDQAAYIHHQLADFYYRRISREVRRRFPDAVTLENYNDAVENYNDTIAKAKEDVLELLRSIEQ